MASATNHNPVGMLAIAAIVLAAFVHATPVRAADPTFPPASRLGLVPPPGMAVSKNFQGFEDVDKNAAILLAVQPAAAYAEIEKSLSAENLKKEDISIDKRETIQLGFGNGILVSGKQAADKTRFRKWLLVALANDVTALVNAQVPEQESAYPDAVMRTALATLVVRTTVPDQEKLSLLPFTVGDLAGFQIESVLPGRAVMLIDAPSSLPTPPDARLFVAAFPGGPSETDDRADFARTAFQQIVGIKDVQITMSEPLRLGGQSGFQTMAQAKDAGTNADIMVAQWLRFGSGGFMQMIGIGRAENWPATLARLRTVRDSVEPK
ncbi:MAG TPA: hypothetical protein VMR17_20560 [Xanthobacteraceae bacterium]|nr:hypothetical protein [Xanthobacteraceae bacterium]